MLTLRNQESFPPCSQLSFLRCPEHGMFLKSEKRDYPLFMPQTVFVADLETLWYFAFSVVVLALAIYNSHISFSVPRTESCAVRPALWSTALGFHLLLRALMRRDRQLLLFISVIS